MLFYRNVYLTIVLIFAVLMVYSVRVAFTKKTPSSIAMGKLLLPVIALVLASVFTYFIHSYKVVAAVQAVYYISFDILIYQLIILADSLNENSEYKAYTFYRCMYFTLVVIDFLILLANVISDFSLSFIKAYVEDQFYGWNDRILPPFIFHLVVCYLACISVMVKFIKGYLQAPKIYRSRFLFALSLFFAAFLMNLFYMYVAQAWTADYSLIVYSVLGILIFQFTLYTHPRNVENKMLSVVTDNITDAVICFDNEGQVIFENLMADGILRCTKNISTISRYLNSREDYINVTDFFDLDGKQHIFKTEFRRLRDKANKCDGSYIKLHDCTEAVQMLAKEEYKAAHDELTGLYNRKVFFEKMETILKNSSTVPRYLVCLDIKDFKLVNDLLGVKFGDHVLQEIALLLLSPEYEDSIAGRISGDKFALLIPKKNFNFKVATAHAEKIKALAKGINYQLQVYLGIYEISNSFENVHTIYDKANMAIKEIYGDYNKVISVYDTSLMQRLIEEKSIVNAFQPALENGDFKMFLQPQIDSKTGKCIGAEALVRWINPETGMRNPGDFIHVLEKGGVIYRLDTYIWEAAVKKLAEWKSKNIDWYISINISAMDFYFTDIYKTITSLVETYQISPKKLNLEITETVLIAGDDNGHKNIINRLRDYGFNIEMDDFGSGYSSLNSLKNIVMDVLKIDMEFLHKTASEERGELIISAVIKMAKNLGMVVVCEGVETQNHVDLLRRLDCDIFQGYYYSRPISVAEFEEKYLEAAK